MPGAVQSSLRKSGGATGGASGLAWHSGYSFRAELFSCAATEGAAAETEGEGGLGALADGWLHHHRVRMRRGLGRAAEVPGQYSPCSDYGSRLGWGRSCRCESGPLRQSFTRRNSRFPSFLCSSPSYRCTRQDGPEGVWCLYQQCCGSAHAAPANPEGVAAAALQARTCQEGLTTDQWPHGLLRLARQPEKILQTRGRA